MNSVTVVIPTYNRASFLPRTLTSVFQQTVPPDEVILIDDGSTDNTEQVVSSLLAQNPGWASRLRYLRQHNQGKSVALNNALRSLKTEWVAFNDSDDTWRPEKLEWQFRALASFPECEVCFTETSLGDFQQRNSSIAQASRGHLGKIEEPSWLFVREWPGTNIVSVLVRANTLRRCGDFDARFVVAEDVDFLFRLGLLTPFCFVNLALVDVDQDPTRPESLTVSHPARSWTAMLIAEARLEKWLVVIGNSDPDLLRAVKHELASARSALANRFLLAGDTESATRQLAKCRNDCPELRLLTKSMLFKVAPGLLRRLIAGRAPSEFLTVAPDDDSTIQNMRLRLAQ